MSLLRALEVAQEIITPEGKIRLTHEAYCYTIVPYAFPPIQVKRVKGHIDRMGRFRPVLPMESGFEISQDEFRQLISPTSMGKPAGDFRISDVVAIWRKRDKPAEPDKSVPPAPASAGPATPAVAAPEFAAGASAEVPVTANASAAISAVAIPAGSAATEIEPAKAAQAGKAV